jgi:hypothetical protein
MELARSIEQLRTFVPAEDFSLSQGFYRSVGFRAAWSSEKMVLFELGGFSFFLQDYFVKVWAENMMLDLRVTNVDAWWGHLQGLNLAQHFPRVRLSAPEDDPTMGVRRAHFVDPSGVLWHVSQGLVKASAEP